MVAFPDGSELQLVGRDRVEYWHGATLHAVDLPHPVPDTGWAHIGLQLSNGNRTAELYRDGYLLDRFEHGEAFFELSPGTLYVGRNPERPSNGARAWIDDFKVIAHASGKEEWCNHAGGTLIGIGAEGAWHDLAGSYPSASHQAISDFLTRFGEPTFPRYACYHDYSGDYAAHGGNIPPEHTGVGASYNFPEGPLAHGQPRPDSSGNAFCRTCHTSDGLQGLDVDALRIDAELSAEDDPRRQPLQPYPRVHGHIPADWLGADSRAPRWWRHPRDSRSTRCCCRSRGPRSRSSVAWRWSRPSKEPLAPSRCDLRQAVGLEAQGHRQQVEVVAHGVQPGELHDIALVEVDAQRLEGRVAHLALTRRLLGIGERGALPLAEVGARCEVLEVAELLGAELRLHRLGQVEIGAERAAVDQRGLGHDQQAQLLLEMEAVLPWCARCRSPPGPVARSARRRPSAERSPHPAVVDSSSRQASSSGPSAARSVPASCAPSDPAPAQPRAGHEEQQRRQVDARKSSHQ